MSGPLKTFRDAIREVSPPWLRRGVAEKVLYSVGIHFDGLLDASVAAVKYRFPGFYGFESLPYIARDRRISRGRYESDATFAARLLRWLDDHRTRGNPYALLRQLHAHFAPNNFPIQLIYASGRRFSMSPDGTITWDDIEWTPPGDPDNWARWWLFYEAPQFISTVNWDDPGVTWDDGHVWDLGLAPPDVQDLASVPNAWNSAHAIGRLVLLQEGESWDSYAPGEWPFQIALKGQLPTMPLTPVNEFSTDVTPPETGLPVAAGVVTAALQKLLNRTEWLFATQRIRTARRLAHLVPTAGAYGGPDTQIPLTLSLSYGAPGENWILDDGRVQVPYPGIYRIDASITVESSVVPILHLTLPTGPGFGLVVGGGDATDERRRAVGHATISITDPATQGIGLFVYHTATIPDFTTSHAARNPVIIEYVGPVSV